jgi:hypothetical protein
MNKNTECLNCKREDFSFRKGYCGRCYGLILKIKKIENGTFLPEVLKIIKNDPHYSFDGSKNEYINQLKNRLKIIKDSYSLNRVSAHDLEFHINNTLRILGKRSLGKFNDSIAHYLGNDLARSYIYQLFSKIQLIKPFKVDYYRIYEAGYKKSK